MRAPYTQLYLHAVWATWDRLPLITPDIELRVYGSINEKCRELNAYPLALGGIEDHLHLLVRLPTTLSVADLLKEVKGASSHLRLHLTSFSNGRALMALLQLLNLKFCE